MKDLIEALQILLQYGDEDYPTWCEYGVLHICKINSEDVSDNDIKRLDELGFFVDEEYGGFMSFKYGSA